MKILQLLNTKHLYYITLTQEERPGHKVDYDLIWHDKINKRQWELVIGEFSGKPFSPDNVKIHNDRCKLFRCMKDVLDNRIIATSKNGSSQTAYAITEKMLVYGLQSYGNTITIFALNRPYPHAYVVSSICSLEIPCRRGMDEEIKIQNLIDRFWCLLRVIIINNCSL